MVEISAVDNDIAVIGMAGRFPGARDVEEFWQNILAGTESITPQPSGPPAAGILDGADMFDAPFFGYSARDAEVLDPQQRLLLECAWEALESAGYDPAACPGSVGVYCGTGLPTYLLFNLANAPGRVDLDQDGLAVMMGNDKGFASTRVSYHLDLRGPSVDVNSACSTSLVAVVTACESLLGFQCDMALAGGAAVNVAPERGHAHREGGPVSADGHCRPFDAAATGTVFGSGAGVVVLKRLSDALADGDTIRAVIKGAAMNNDGSSKVGFAAPSIEGQAEVIGRALAVAGVDAGSVGYVEAHGTGTRLGDPIEVAALTRAFRESAGGVGFCALGSVKSNVGHLDAAAGVAGLMKAVLVVERGLVPPSLHFSEPNPEIDFEGGPFYVNGVLRRWEGGEVPRRAGVSSFGFGGTNAHVVVEEPPPSAPKARSEHADELLMISARTPAALAKVRERLADHLERHLDLDLADVAHTLRSGRKHFAYRQALVCPDVAAVARTLRSGTAKPDRAIDSPSVGFLFPGQGSQRAGMAVGWYDRIPAFRKAVDECVGLLEPRLGRDVGRCLLSTDARVAEELQRTDLAQPALFVVEYALACALAEWGIRPEAMIGHSVGEYVAACLAGVLSLADALHLVSQRGSLMQGTAHGAMLSVDAPHEVLRRFESADVAIAAVNTTASGVLSGPDASIERVESALDAEGVSHRRLKTAHAFHSPAMDEVLDRFREVVRTVELNEPQTPYVSTLTGTWVRGEDVCDPEYWVRQLRETVNFDAGLRTLLDKPHRVLLEVGPGQSLTTLARHHDTRADQPVIATGTRPGDERGTFAGLLDAVGRLWAAGVRVDWRTVVPPGSHRRLPLPTYPFERERYWIEAAPDSPKAVRGVRQYVPGWRRSVPLELGAWPQSSERSRAWLVFADENGIAARVASRLRGRGDVVTIVVAGDGFHADSGDRHVVRPGDRGDYRRLLDHLAAVGRWPTDVLHLWSLHHQEPGGPDERLDSALTTGLHSVLALGSALVDRGDLSELSVVFAVSGTQSVTGDESIRPERATVLGPCKVIPQEIPEVSCRVVDVDLPRDEGGLDRLAARLEEEARTARPEPLVAYRGTTRWVQTFEPVDIDDVPSGLRDRGVYLITGGFGRIGLAIGRHLAATAHARLVIVGRTVVPDRAEWPAWLAGHAADDQVSVRIRSVEELERSGAEVLVLAADVTDAEAIRSVVDTAHRVFGALDGVIHAAGGTDAAVLCPIADLDVERCEEILSPRVVAPMAFAAALAEYPPADFVVLQSSLATVLGGPGLAAYAAANSFLDAWALEQNGRERPQWTSIGWDVWRTGGAGEHVLDGLRGAEIFAAVAGLRGAPQLLVSDGDIEIKARESLSRVRKKEDAPLHTRPELAQACVLPDSELEHTVARVWQELLRIEPVGVHDNFFELGGDSILATQLVVRLRSAIGRELPLQALFESPTVHSLVAALEEADRSAEQPGAPVLVALSREARRARKSDLTDVTPRRASSGRKG